MAKIIKRAGIVFFVLVISFLLIFGCLVATGTIFSDKNTDLQNNNSNAETTADMSYTLSGTCTQKAATWNTAVTYSKNNSGVNVNITLGSDWIAASDSTYTTSFGTGDGFDNGRICIPSGVTITLDLNGYALNRNLSSARTNGGVIYVSGNFTLKDSYYTKEKAQTLDSIAKIESTRIGKITGGNTSSARDGALNIYGNAAICNIYGGIFYNNSLNYSPIYNYPVCASAIMCDSWSKTYFYGGLVAFNNTISIENSFTNIYLSVVMNADYAYTYIYDLVIRNNYGSNTATGTAAGFRGAESHSTNVGAGFQCYDNKLIDSDKDSNFNDYCNILEPLNKDGKVTRIGVTMENKASSFNGNYNTYNNGVNPLKYFFSDDYNEYIIALKGSYLGFEKKLISEKYEYTYYEGGYRKNYSDNNVIHGKNDYNLLENCGMSNAILGSILPNTSINTFITNINFAGAKIILYDNKGNIVYNKGTASNGIDASNGLENAVGTGWKLETYSDSNVKIETVYLSVLGDINGDGRISASDIAILRQLANDKTLFDKLRAIEKLACLIDNRGTLTTVDGEILRLVIQKITNINIYF